MLRPASLACAAAVALVGCGGGSHEPAIRGAAAALPYSAINSRNTRIVSVDASTYRAPIAAYRRHVHRQLTAMDGPLARLQNAIASGDLSAARAAWLRADYLYETIGAAYGAFGELDARINGLPGGLPGGVRSSQFTGLHRVELGLWGRGSTGDAARPAARLRRDVASLRGRIGGIEIEPLDFALRSHEVLEDSLHLQLAGRGSPWSGAALNALSANVAGTRVVLKGVGPIATRVNPLRVERARRSLDRLERAIDSLRRGGRLPRWDTLGRRDRERISGFTAAAAEELAYMPELADPRPPPATKSPIQDPTR